MIDDELSPEIEVSPGNSLFDRFKKTGCVIIQPKDRKDRALVNEACNRRPRWNTLYQQLCGFWR